MLIFSVIPQPLCQFFGIKEYMDAACRTFFGCRRKVETSLFHVNGCQTCWESYPVAVVTWYIISKIVSKLSYL